MTQPFLDEADQWMIREVKRHLMETYGLEEANAAFYMADYQFEDWLLREPEFVHHEGPAVWAKCMVERQRNVAKHH